MSELANLFETIERWTPETSDSPSFRLIRSLTLAFIEHVLPCWPILLPKQLQSLFQTYHDYGKLARYRYMPPDYQAFLHVLTIGHIFASFNDHSDLHQLITLLGLQDEIRPGAEAVSGTGVNCPSANVTDLQVQALRDLYLHYNVQFGRERLRTVELMELHRCQVDENWDPTEDWWTLTMMWTTFNLQRMHPKYFAFVQAFATAAFACHKHITDFRLYGGTDCFTANLGVWTVIEGDFRSDECNTLRTNEIGEVNSMMLVDICDSCERKAITSRPYG
ncbi:37S ribosomal protein S17, mitochondrial [Purpureocillium lavendulum]|uniref:37S ribosomal protein S17, mitochondrial n=1 Tax=Purpureocillium lavendulum TaxID=1247861 RepID=A0AB34FP73_9HYPO|nr:37S ribosomal protein S17, mitochondrial [Purpureocillium lavendulum]